MRKCVRIESTLSCWFGVSVMPASSAVRRGLGAGAGAFDAAAAGAGAGAGAATAGAGAGTGGCCAQAGAATSTMARVKTGKDKVFMSPPNLRAVG